MANPTVQHQTEAVLESEYGQVRERGVRDGLRMEGKGEVERVVEEGEHRGC